MKRTLMTIQQRFEAFALLLPPDVTPEERQKLRNVYFAGFAVCHDLVLLEVAALSEAQAEVEFQAITDELEQYAKQMLQDRVSKVDRSKLN